ncbi:dolichol kinase-like isoform X2 [Stegodyphus dumicola]|uniref:dolichol kinase-like isoform X2 n=1 Tax=Stegodyphus dumicola TaxID=202533 RepID=UPI0015AA347C|nr:dolichol kinase-like isoform X2 [Stegodyphus dumicola]
MDYKFRLGADHGLWCSFLLPLCLLPYAITPNSGVYRLLFTVCIWLIISGYLWENLFLCKIKHNVPANYICYILAIPASAVVWYIHPWSIWFSFIVCCFMMVYYNLLISILLTNCPRTFTLGEVQIIAQGILLFILSCILSLLNELDIFPDKSLQNIIPVSVKFMQVLLLGCLLLVYVLHKFTQIRHGLSFHICCVSFGLLMLLVWSYVLDENPVMWLLLFCLKNKIRIFLLLFWVVSTFTSIFFVIWINQVQNQKVSTITRKYFHIIVNAVFIPGIIYDLELLHLASGIALTVFIVLEMYRVLDVYIIGPAINNAFQIFLDEKDSGVLILTHIYLLIGCSCPLWLYPYSLTKGYHICLLSGIISVGFGDTAAALGGSLFGKHFWKNSKKTFEGTACAIVSQLVCCYPFLSVGHTFSIWNILLVTTSIIFTSLLEATTSQVDNLVLPLFMFSFLSWIQ